MRERIHDDLIPFIAGDPTVFTADRDRAAREWQAASIDEIDFGGGEVTRSVHGVTDTIRGYVVVATPLPRAMRARLRAEMLVSLVAPLQATRAVAVDAPVTMLDVATWMAPDIPGWRWYGDELCALTLTVARALGLTAELH